MKSKKCLLLTDFDGTAVDTFTPTRDFSLHHLYTYVKRLEPNLTWEGFTAQSEKMRRQFGSLTQAWQFRLGQGAVWSFNIWEDKKKEYVDLVARHTVPDPEVPLLLRELQIRHGCRIAIFTQSPECVVRPIMEHLGYNHLFDDDHLIDIRKLNNMTKLNLLTVLYVREHFGKFGWDYDERHIFEDMPANMTHLRRPCMGFMGWHINPQPHPLGGYDYHAATFKGALLALPTARYGQPTLKVA